MLELDDVSNPERDLSTVSIAPVGSRMEAVQSVYGLRAIQRVNERIGYESRQSPPSASFYDVDGVLTSPLTKLVHPDVIQELRQQLIDEEIVAFNTGRSAEWTMSHVVAPLCEVLSPDELIHLSKLFIAAEKGAVWIEYSPGIGFQAYRERNLSVSHDLIEGAQGLLEQFEKPRLAIDLSKDAMLSLEFAPDEACDINDEFAIFIEQRQLIEEGLKELLSAHGLEAEFTIDVTKIAIDVQHRGLGKDCGAERILHWLTGFSDFPSHVTTYGDSKSDIAMAVFLKGKGISVQHVHVGDSTDLVEDKSGIDVYAPEQRFDEGTLEHRAHMRKALAVPTTNNELLSSFSTMEGLTENVASWYDKVFLTAERVEIDRSDAVIRVFIEGEAPPVALNARFSSNGSKTVGDLSKLRPTRSSNGDVETIGDNSSAILISGGVVPFIKAGDEELIVFIQRGMGAPVAPGQLQTAAGRCDRLVGHCSFQELSEEYLLTAKRGGESVFLAVSNESLSRQKQIDTIRSAAKRAVEELELRMSVIESGDFSSLESALDLSEEGIAFEIASLRSSIQKLQSITQVVFIDGMHKGDETLENTFCVETYLNGELIESVDNMHAVYEPSSNTLEMRVPLVLDLESHGLSNLELYDGDGFGRNVMLLSRENALQSELPMHSATASFLEDLR